MDSEPMTSSRSYKKRNKPAMARKSSALVLMPWEKRHQHSMETFLKKSRTSNSAVQENTVFNSSIDQESVFCTTSDEKRRRTSGKKMVNCDAKEDENLSIFKGNEKGANCQKQSVTTQDDCVQSVPKKNDHHFHNDSELTFLEEKSLVRRQNLNSHNMPISQETWLDDKQNYKFKIDLLENTNVEGCDTVVTEAFRSVPKYNLDSVFIYEKGKNRRPLWERLSKNVCHSEDLKNSEKNGLGKLDDNSKKVRNRPNYNMEELFKYQNPGKEKPLYQRLNLI